MDSLFLSFLAQHDDAAWLRLIDRIAHAIHPVDRAPTRVWFHLYPLALDRLMSTAKDPKALAQRMFLRGRWCLAEQIDSSHSFLYGHRFWPDVRQAVIDYATRGSAPSSLDVGAQIQELAGDVSRRLGAERALLVGIVAVGMRTLQQAGLERMTSAPGTISLSPWWRRRTPEQVLAARMRDDSQGLWGWLRGGRKRWSVTFVESDPKSRFPLIDSQHITTAAAVDKRDYRTVDPRCTEGPIPVQCRSCSCGTCWVGILGGAEKLSPIDSRERDKLAELGYLDTRDERPQIRLACMAQAYGAVSMVIPPWNGQLGRHGKNLTIAERTGSR